MEREDRSSNLRVTLSGVSLPTDQAASDEAAPQELCLIDAGIQSMLNLPLVGRIQTLNLHCNSISKLENLQHLPHLRHLDLSSNRLVRIEGLERLGSLRTLNVACNRLVALSGLGSLKSLKRLNASYNQIQDVTGLRDLHGPNFSLAHLHLHGNQLSSAEHVIGCLVGLSHLQHATFQHEESDNPVCRLPGYRAALLNSVPQLVSLDGLDRTGMPAQSEDGLSDVPGLEQYLDILLSSDIASNPEQEKETPLQIITPKIDQVLERFRQRALASSGTSGSGNGPEDRRDTIPAPLKQPQVRHSQHSASNHEERLRLLEQQLNDVMARRLGAVDVSPSTESQDDAFHPPPRRRAGAGRVAKRDTDHTDESDKDANSGSETRKGDKLRGGGRGGGRQIPAGVKPGRQSGEGLKTTSKKPTRSKVKSSPSSHRDQDASTSPSSGQDKRGRGKASATEHIIHTTAEQDADKLSLLQELDNERERRWKAEQAAIRLADHIKELQSKANEEKELQEVAVEASGRLKQALMNEKELNTRLDEQLQLFKEKLKEVSQKLATGQKSEEDQRQALRAMEETAKKMETEKLKDQAHNAKRLQEYQLRAAAMEREVELVRVKASQQETKIQQLQELLANREQEHRNELKSYFKPGSKEIQEMIDRELKREQEKQEHGQIFYKERIETLTKQYAELEDEFRLALQIESNRFQEVQEAYERASHDAAQCRQLLSASVEKEKRASSLVSELTAMVKEQKGRITELSRAKQEAVSSTRSRIQSLEHQVEESQRKLQVLEALRQEKSRLAAQLVAQDSVMEGLKQERKLWGQELAQQGASLAQDRGRLEARIEALDAEVASLKKQLERENDTIRIKTQIIDDQTDSIKKLKDGLVEKDDEVKAAREETLKVQQSLEDRLATEQSAVQELTGEVERLAERKDQLKERAEGLQEELEESRRAYRALDNKWKEKGDIIRQLETQVRQVKENFDQREKKLREERDRALQAEKASVEKLRSVDDAFRRQMEAAQRGHEEHMDQLRQEKQSELDAAMGRVADVEEEMRQLLSETAAQKRLMEEKVRRLTQAFSELQDLG
ncbi:leucine-rich repeat and coiled-coil domain-containing protein 1-like [Diadema antillarum]|uniref:leucine-rich repeat and coiled-coil domain-containing protein 1-like n=1 Tax=Diadema antillarum TaxID=105358 RepID=UPI003A85D53F